MDKNSSWVAGLIVLVIVVVIGVGGYGIYRYHKDHSIVPPPSTSHSGGGSGSGGNSTTPAPSPTPAPTASCYTAARAASEEGQTGCVQFTGYAYTSSNGQMYLDQSLSAPYGFSAYIPAGSSFGPSLLNQYSGQNIDVTGSIVNYNGEPEIVVNSASQIQLAQ